MRQIKLVAFGFMVFELMVIVSLAACGKTSPTAGAADSKQQAMGRAMPDAGKIEHVKVQATGHGPTLPAAVDQAIQLAVEQVNGKSFDASSSVFQGGFALAVGTANVDIGSSAFATLVNTQSRGAVTDFKILTQDKSLLGREYTVAIEASVAKFSKPATADRLRIVVAPFATGRGGFVMGTSAMNTSVVVQEIRDQITNTLSQTNRLSVLDREFSSEIQAELDFDASAAAGREEFARVGQQLGADFLVLGRIDRYEYKRYARQLRTSEKQLEWHSGGATLNFRLVNVATGQIEMSDSVAVDMPATDPTTLGDRVDLKAISKSLSSKLAAQVGREIVLRLFPITVVSVEGNSVVLSQGGQTLSEGAEYEIMLRGKELTDPQTGQVIGRLEKPCCSVKITRVTPELSYGDLVRKDIDPAQAFAPGALELRGPVQRTAVLPVDKPSVAGKARPDTVAKEDGDVAVPVAKKDSNW